jgi:signal transduction histidine kinase
MDFWTRLAFASGTFATISFFAFIAAYPPNDTWPSPRVIRLAFAVATVIAIVEFVTDLIAFGPYMTTDGLKRRSGPLYQVFACSITAVWVSAFAVFISRWRVARGRARTQLQYLGAGMVVPGVAVLFTNLFWPFYASRSYGWIGPWFAVAFVTIVGHAIIRRRLPDLNLVAHRSLTVATAIFLSAAPVVALIIVLWPRLLRQLDAIELGVLLVAVAAVTVLVPITRDVANRLLDRYVYRTHANYQRTLREASQLLTRVLHLETLLAFISTTVVRSTAAEGVALYLWDGGAFNCAVTEKASAAHGFIAPPIVPIEIVAALDAAREPILADELARDRDGAATGLHARLAEADWSLLLPVVAEDRLIAMIAVGPKLSGDAFYQQDIDLLMTLANQASVAIKNARLYEAVVVANEYLENIAATIESGVAAVNASGQIAMLNRAAQRLLGLEGWPRKSTQVSTLPLCLSEPLQATVSDGEARTLPEIDLPTVNSNGDTPQSRPVMCTTSPVRDPSGSIVGAVAVFSDLTPLRELEAERRHAERLVYFQALASGIAHEIKNPLVAIKTFTQLLPRRLGDTRFLEEFGRMSTREIERVQRLVDRFQTLSRPQGGPRSPVDLRVPLLEALELYQPTLEEKRITTTILISTVPYFIVGNKEELEQIFLNLLLNAHDAMPSGGHIAIELARADAHVTINIADNGPGIPTDVLDRVFEPFFTTKPRGSGLGLAISAGIAQAHGGRLRAANRMEGGAVFTVEFPTTLLTSAVSA